MKKYRIKNFSTKKLIIYSIIAFVIVIVSILLTSKWIGEKIYPGIIFLIISGISIIWIKNNCWNIYQINIDENNIYINNKSYRLKEIEKYSFNETEKFYGFRLFLKSYKLFLNIPKKDSSDYLKLKKEIIGLIKKENQKVDSKSITQYEWYKTKSAKIYGYVIICLLLSWILVMIIYSEKLKFFNFDLFLMVTAGLFPIILKIFRRTKSK